MNLHPYKDDPRFLTVQEVADALHMSKKAVYDLLHSGQLASSRRGRQYRILRTDLQAYQEILTRSSTDDKFNVALPQSIIDSFARHLVTEIRAYYDSSEGQAAFTAWLEQQEENL